MIPVEPDRMIRVAITGIDGSGKSTTLSRVVDRLGVEHKIVKASNRPVYSVVSGRKQYHYRTLIKLVDMLHAAADRSGNPHNVCAVNAFHVVLQGRLIEPSLIGQIQPDLVIGARDLLIDPSVYATFYSPRLAIKSMPERIDFMKKITGFAARDLVFFLDLPPEEAVRRIEERIKGEQESNEAVERAKWRHMHENVESLALLQAEYYRALEEIKSRFQTSVVAVDTGSISVSDVSEFIVSEIRKTLSLRATGNITEHSPYLQGGHCDNYIEPILEQTVSELIKTMQYFETNS